MSAARRAAICVSVEPSAETRFDPGAAAPAGGAAGARDEAKGVGAGGTVRADPFDPEAAGTPLGAADPADGTGGAALVKRGTHGNRAIIAKPSAMRRAAR